MGRQDVTTDPDSGLPIGPLVAVAPARLPERITLPGVTVRLEPLDARRHAASLFAETHDDARHVRFQYLFEAPFADLESFTEHLTRKAASDDPLFYVVVDNSTDLAVGQMTLMRIERSHRSIEVGNILLGRSLTGTVGSTEAQYLLMRYAFESLGYRRYEWKCNALNAPSRRAAERLGFCFEGLFRQHYIIRGRSRDTAWYSIVDAEWPWVRRGFEQWLQSDNFDSARRQRRTLAECRGGRPMNLADLPNQDTTSE